MKAAFTRPIAFLLLALAALPWLITTLQQYRQKHIRHEMKESLEKEMLQTITLHEDEVTWTHDEKEIWVNGRMFDIKSSFYHDHQYTFTGLFDEQETGLLKQIHQQQQKENAEGLGSFVKLFQLLAINHDQQFVHGTGYSLQSRNYINYTPSLNSIYSRVSTPPPRQS